MMRQFERYLSQIVPGTSFTEFRVSSTHRSPSYYTMRKLKIHVSLGGSGKRHESSSVGESHPHALTYPDGSPSPRVSLTCHNQQLSPYPEKCQLSFCYLARASVGGKISDCGDKGTPVPSGGEGRGGGKIHNFLNRSRGIVFSKGFLAHALANTEAKPPPALAAFM